MSIGSSWAKVQPFFERGVKVFSLFSTCFPLFSRSIEICEKCECGNHCSSCRKAMQCFLLYLLTHKVIQVAQFGKRKLCIFIFLDISSNWGLSLHIKKDVELSQVKKYRVFFPRKDLLTYKSY